MLDRVFSNPHYGDLYYWYSQWILLILFWIIGCGIQVLAERQTEIEPHEDW